MGGVHLGIVLSIALALMVPIVVYAAPLPSDTQTIGIQLSQTCQTMLKNNVTTTCPSYEDLVNLGWDDSLPGSGEFEYDNGFYHRGIPMYKNVHELYRYDDYHILIDPPSSIASRTKIIIINPTLPEYIPLGEYKKEDHQRIVAKDRYVADCKEATITSDNWQFMISDTIYYLRNGCTHTNFEELTVIDDYISTMDRTTSKQYKHDRWIEESIEKCKTQICKEY
jgi:hypothetical protein